MAKLTLRERLTRLRTLGRPTITDYIPLIFDDFMELHGDRHYGDDAAVLGGIALFDGKPVTVLAHVNGGSLAELKRANFAMAHPEGHRKALRLAKQAEKFHRPVICFIDTPGAFDGVEAESRGQGESIARNLIEFIELKTPVISIVIGRGGSGGALALGVCDELAIQENALYSIISPKGFAAIVWKDPAREHEAAALMKITAEDIFSFGICDRIIPDPDDPNDAESASLFLKEYLKDALRRFSTVDAERLVENRYNKYRRIGVC